MASVVPSAYHMRFGIRDDVKQLVTTNSWMWSLKDESRFKWASRFLGGPVGRILYRQMNFSPRVLMKMIVGDKSKLPKHIHDHYLKALPTPRERKGTWVFAKELVVSSAEKRPMESRSRG